MSHKREGMREYRLEDAADKKLAAAIEAEVRAERERVQARRDARQLALPVVPVEKRT